MMILIPVSRIQSGRRIAVLQKPRSKDAQYDHFGTRFHMKIPHDFDSQAEKNCLDCAAETLDDHPFGKLVAGQHRSADRDQ